MNRLKQASFGFSGLAVAALAPAHSAVLIPIVPVANSTTTTAFGVNDSNNIAGSFIGSDDGVERGFFGSLDGTYTIFDAGDGGTEPRGLNNNGYITGFSNSQGSGGDTSTQPIFERSPDGQIVNVKINGQQLFGVAQGISNSKNTFAGSYWDKTDFDTVAFLGRDGQWLHDIKIPAVHQFSNGGGINRDNVMVGSFFAPPRHGFILSHKVLTVVDYPSDKAVATSLEGVSDKGRAVGQWYDDQGKVRSFMLDIATNTFTDIVVKGAVTVTQAWSINSHGAVAVSSDAGSFIWCASRRRCPTGGAEIAAPVHVVAKGFPQYVCDRTCDVPKAKIGERAQLPRIPGMIKQ